MSHFHPAIRENITYRSATAPRFPTAFMAERRDTQQSSRLNFEFLLLLSPLLTSTPCFPKGLPGRGFPWPTQLFCSQVRSKRATREERQTLIPRRVDWEK